MTLFLILFQESVERLTIRGSCENLKSNTKQGIMCKINYLNCSSILSSSLDEVSTWKFNNNLHTFIFIKIKWKVSTLLTSIIWWLIFMKSFIIFICLFGKREKNVSIILYTILFTSFLFIYCFIQIKYNTF